VTPQVAPQVAKSSCGCPAGVPGPNGWACSTVQSAVSPTNAVKLRDYLKGRAGQRVSMKEIQSRFKGTTLTCKQWADLVANVGLSVDSRGPVSTWTTGM